jgi:Short C-terminal domain
MLGVRLLVVVGTLLTFISVLAVWVDRLALDTDTWVDTSEQLLEDEEIRARLAVVITEQLYANVDVAAELEQALPPQAEAFAAPAAAGLKEVTQRAALRVLEGPRVIAAWREANRVAHEQFVSLVEGGGEVVQTEGGEVRLFLRPLLEEVAQETGLGERLLERLPEDAGGIVILQSDQLDTLQTLMRVLDLLATWLWAIALGLFALAVYLSPGRRLKTLRGIAYGVLFVGLAVLVVLRLGGGAVLESVVRVPANEPAAQNAFEIFTSLLKTSAWTLVVLALIAIVGTWLAGPGRRATGFRHGVAPVMRERPEIVWGVFAFIVLLVLLWGPTRATSTLVGIVVLVGLAALGLEAFRRHTAREFPEATFGEGWSLGDAARGAFGRARGDSAGEASAADRVGQLERLSELHRRGELSDEEFQAEKAALLRAHPQV